MTNVSASSGVERQKVPYGIVTEVLELATFLTALQSNAVFILHVLYYNEGKGRAQNILQRRAR